MTFHYNKGHKCGKNHTHRWGRDIILRSSLSIRRPRWNRWTGQGVTISAERASQAEAGAKCKGPEVEKCLNAQGQCCWNGVGPVQGVKGMRSEGTGAANR